MNHRLYGDGVHADGAAIQELLDSGASEVALPAPRDVYLLDRTLRIHSGQTLRLGETTRVRLMDGVSAFMLTNAEKPAHDICVTGGIWDYHNLGQAPNPIRCGKYGPSHMDGKAETVVRYDDSVYRGSIMRFYGVERFSLHDVTFRDPVTYCLEMACMKYFTVENVRFDMNLGNPTAENMDGIHVDGGCRYGSIRNVQGSCYDDVVALNADDGCDGPIRDIEVDGVFGDHCLRAVRLLSTKSLVSDISVSNVRGTYYQNCVVVAYFYPPTGVRGQMRNLSFRNLSGGCCHRIPEYGKGDDSHFHFAFFWVDGNLDVDSISIEGLHRTEEVSDAGLLRVCRGARIGSLTLTDALQRNETGRALPFFRNEGEIGRLYLRNVDPGEDELLVNEGEIGKLVSE